MSATAAFWIGFLAGDVFAAITVLFVLALLHAAKSGDETGAATRGRRASPRPGRMEASPSIRPGLTHGCGND